VSLSESFIAKGDYGVDACGATRGDEARQQSDDRQQAGDAGKSERVGGANSEKGGQEPREGQRREKSESDAEKHEARPLCQHEAQNIAALGAERDANAELLGRWVTLKAIKP